MMRKTLSFFIILSMLLFNINITTVNASEDYDSRYIKVGIERNVPAKSSINLTGEGFSIGISNGNINEFVKINTHNIVAKSKNFSYHIELSESFISYDKALEKTKYFKSLGIESYVAYDSSFKVFIGEFISESAAKEFVNNSPILKSQNAVVSKNEVLVSIENSNNEKIIVFDNNQDIFLKSLGEVTKVENKRYRGYIGFINSKNKLTAINYVQLSDYLKGVIPREMSASWNIEALKAQAVTARTFALRNLGKHKSLGYELCDTTNCQMYDGYDIEHTNSNRAVEETRNNVLKYNGEIAQTFYSSCSGGYTSNNEDIWNGVPIPYLRGKEDPYSLNTPQSNWTYTISKAEASMKLKSNKLDVGDIISLKPVRDRLGGRVLELIITGTKGTKVLEREKVREVFGYSNVKSTNYRIDGEIELPKPQPEPNPEPTPETPPVPENPEKDIYVISANSTSPTKSYIKNINVVTADGIKKIDYNLQNVVISNGVQSVVKESNKAKEEFPIIASVSSLSMPTNVGNTITFRGSGWGHGVGMSQYGALNMAKQGFNYIDIVEFYFTGAKVE